MEDDYLNLSDLFSSSCSSLKYASYQEYLRNREDLEKELEEHKAVFTDLEDLETAINETGSRPWPEPKKLTVSWSGQTSAIKYEDFVNLIMVDTTASYTDTAVSYNTLPRFYYYDYSFEDSF